MTQKQKKVFELLSNPIYNEIQGREVLSKDLLKQLCNEISDMVNTLSFKPEKFVEAVLTDSLSRETFLQIALLWIDKMSNTKEFDKRNEYSIEVSKKIAELENVKSAIAFYRKMFTDENLKDFNFSKCTSVDSFFKTAVRVRCPIPVIVVEYMSREHRTIQQTFSSLVFYFLLKSGGERWEDLKEFEKENPKFFITPFI